MAAPLSPSATTIPAFPPDINVRFDVARKIVERAADYGIPREDVVVDPLVMPVGAMSDAGVQVFSLIRRLREELQVNTTCGAFQCQFWPAQPARAEPHLPGHGHRGGPDFGDHQSAGSPADAGRSWRLMC